MPNAYGRPDRHRAERQARWPPATPAAARSSRTSAATPATRNSARSPKTRSTPVSATTARPARGATRRTGPAAAGRRTRRPSCTRIHAAAKRNDSVHLACHGDRLLREIVYPGVLAHCEQCHLPGSYDFTLSASADAAGLGSDQTDKRLIREAAKGIRGGTSQLVVPRRRGLPTGVDYGVSGARIRTSCTSPTRRRSARGAMTRTCAVSHMKVNGGSFYEYARRCDGEDRAVLRLPRERQDGRTSRRCTRK